MSLLFILARPYTPLANFSNRKAVYDTIANNAQALGLQSVMSYTAFCANIRKTQSCEFKAHTGHSVNVYKRDIHRHALAPNELLLIL